jgi:hypothetical protein
MSESRSVTVTAKPDRRVCPASHGPGAAVGPAAGRDAHWQAGSQDKAESRRSGAPYLPPRGRRHRTLRVFFLHNVTAALTVHGEPGPARHAAVKPITAVFLPLFCTRLAPAKNQFPRMHARRFAFALVVAIVCSTEISGNVLNSLDASTGTITAPGTATSCASVGEFRACFARRCWVDLLVTGSISGQGDR